MVRALNADERLVAAEATLAQRYREVKHLATIAYRQGLAAGPPLERLRVFYEPRPGIDPQSAEIVALAARTGRCACGPSPRGRR